MSHDFLQHNSHFSIAALEKHNSSSDTALLKKLMGSETFASSNFYLQKVVDDVKTVR